MVTDTEAETKPKTSPSQLQTKPNTMITPAFTVRLDSATARLHDIGGLAAEMIQKHDTGSAQEYTLHPADYALLPAQLTSRIRTLIQH